MTDTRSPLDPHDLPSTVIPLPGYLLRIRPNNPGTHGDWLVCDFDLVQTYDSDGGPAYPRDDHMPKQIGPNEFSGTTTVLAEAEIALEGFAKWDGCTQYWTSDAHFDDVAELHEFLAAIAQARYECAAILGRDVLDEYDGQTGQAWLRLRSLVPGVLR